MRTGLLAEFDTPVSLVRAIRALRAGGYRRLDAFTPYPLRPAEDALGLERSVLPWIVFPLALTGAGIGYLIQWYCNAYDYPLNVGGRALHSAPAFIPITFETGVLTAALVGFVAFFALSKLPELSAPIFDAPGFERASVDRFWIGVDDRDPAYNTVDLERRLRDLGALSVYRAVEHDR